MPAARPERVRESIGCQSVTCRRWARRQASPARVQRNALPDHRDRARGGPPNDHGPRNHRRPCAHQGVHPARHDARCLRRSGLGPIPSNRGHDDPNHVYRHATTPGQRAHPGPPDRDPRAGSCWDHYCDGTRTNHVHVHLRDHRGRGSHHGDHPSATTSPVRHRVQNRRAHPGSGHPRWNRRGGHRRAVLSYGDHPTIGATDPRHEEHPRARNGPDSHLAHDRTIQRRGGPVIPAALITPPAGTAIFTWTLIIVATIATTFAIIEVTRFPAPVVIVRRTTSAAIARTSGIIGT